jgi:phosphatidate cytidylyltransferase
MTPGTKKRLLTGLVLIPAIVVAIWWGPPWLIAFATALVSVLALLEFFALADRLGFHAYRFWTCAAALAIIAQQWDASRAAGMSGLGEVLVRARSPQVTLDLVMVGFVFGAAAIALWSRRALADVLPSVCASAAALVLIVVPFSAVVRLDGVPGVGRELLLFTLALVWAGDTAAYFVGRAIGHRKMSPQLSPGKTWEGALANLLGAWVVGGVFGTFLGIGSKHLLIMAVLASVAGQIGDAFESGFKRSAGVKDSGTLLPGHGGMLDRIDALILAAPAVWYYFEWVVMRRP